MSIDVQVFFLVYYYIPSLRQDVLSQNVNHIITFIIIIIILIINIITDSVIIIL